MNEMEQQASAVPERCMVMVSQALDMVLFPVEGQATLDYTQFRAALADQNSESFQLISIAIAGDKKRVRKLTRGWRYMAGRSAALDSATVVGLQLR